MAVGFRSRSAQWRVSAETSSLCASQSRVRQLSPTPSLRIEQPPARQEQIRQRCGDFQSVQVLRQASVTHLLKAEDPLDHPKDVLDLGAHAGFATVGRLDRLVDAFAPPVTLVGKVLRPRRPGADRGLLSAVRVITPRVASEIRSAHSVCNNIDLLGTRDCRNDQPSSGKSPFGDEESAALGVEARDRPGC